MAVTESSSSRGVKTNLPVFVFVPTVETRNYYAGPTPTLINVIIQRKSK